MAQKKVSHLLYAKFQLYHIPFKKGYKFQVNKSHPGNHKVTALKRGETTCILNIVKVKAFWPIFPVCFQIFIKVRISFRIKVWEFLMVKSRGKMFGMK